ncbi:MAG: HAD-IA family hydrolase, partial [Burkholderiaceae bacterium]|nr:HAD-IA family hydrolase [Burkholderiaceae bacterium]
LTGELDGEAPREQFGAAIDSFRVHYRRENGVHSRPYPGVLEGLAVMRGRGLRLAVVTNKPSDFTLPLLAAADIDSFFDLVVSGDTLATKKPDPDPMLHVCQRFGVEPAKMVAIGDSLHDVRAARAAGIPVIVVPYGYNEGRDVRELDVDAIVATLREAAGLIDPV